MALYRIADFIMDIKSRYQHIPRQCAAYLAPEGSVPDFTIEVSEEEIDASLTASGHSSRGYHESICAYRHIATEILQHGGMVMHAAVVGYDGGAYAFSAKSTTGKSTHISLWRECFGESVTVINGDKPILRIRDGKVYAYGTPWCGKEGWNTNTSAPLTALCFLERSPENYIHPLDTSEAFNRIVHQLIRPRDAAQMDLTLQFTDLLLRTVPTFVLGCNISHEAAELSFRTLTAVKGE